MKDVINESAAKHSKDTYLGSDLRRRDEFCTVLFAGYETTANTLGFTMHELVFNPRHQELIYDEIQALLKDEKKSSFTEIEFKDLNKLKEVIKVIREAQRKWPAIPGGTSRVCDRDVIFPLTSNRLKTLITPIMDTQEIVGGFLVPKGTPLFFPFFSIHRDPATWPEPAVFNPDRKWNENSLTFFFSFFFLSL